MGYFKDNFPGSEAYFQRLRVARAVVGYSVVVGGLFFAFSPLSKRVRKAVEDGSYKDPEWMTEKLGRKWEANPFTGIPIRKTIESSLDSIENAAHFDFTRTKKEQKEIQEQQKVARASETGTKPYVRPPII